MLSISKIQNFKSYLYPMLVINVYQNKKWIHHLTTTISISFICCLTNVVHILFRMLFICNPSDSERWISSRFSHSFKAFFRFQILYHFVYLCQLRFPFLQRRNDSKEFYTPIWLTPFTSNRFIRRGFKDRVIECTQILIDFFSLWSCNNIFSMILATYQILEN